jgi:hypothetical protein
MSVAWYFSVNAVPTGPLTWDELRESAAGGKFGPEDFVWSSGSGSEWRKASTIESLFPKPEPSPPPLPPPGDTPPAPRPRDPIAIEIVPIASPFADPDATALPDAGRPAVKCLQALAKGWRQTHQVLFAEFSLRRWFLFALCIMFTQLYQQNPLAFLSPSGQSGGNDKHIERLGLQKVVESGVFKLQDLFAATAAEEPAPPPTLEALIKALKESLNLLANAARETSIALVKWFGDTRDYGNLAAAGAVLFFVFVIGVWFSARGFVMFFTRLYVPDSPLFATWIEGEAAARTLFRGLFWIRLVFKTAQLVLAVVAIRTLAAVPLVVPVPIELWLQIVGGALLVWLGDVLLMGFVNDFVMPLVVLEKRKFVPAFFAALRISGLWLIRYLALLAGVFAAAMTLLMGVSALFGITLAIAMLFMLPFFSTILLLPLHMLRRLWSLNIVFMLRPELRKAVPEIKAIRIVK